MKGVTFYLEYPSRADKRTKRGNPPVLATVGYFYQKCWNYYVVDAIGAARDGNRVQFITGAVDGDYLRANCTRISEAKAREIHPEIFNCGLL